MRPIPRIAPLALMLLVIACGVTKTAEELWSTSEQKVKAREYQRAIKALETLVRAYPEHALAPRAQFQIGDIYMNNITDLQKSLAAYRETAASYPETDEGVKALFMIGFVSANHLGDYQTAREAYQDFLHRYPHHELVPSVQFELENLGKSVEEIDALKGVVDAN
ncbi:MAG: tetratricopeptide repeat protein [Candidatus Neomarinimicrobiota bacterium]